MKKETRDQILRSYDDACRLMGFVNFSAFLREACREAEKQLHAMRRARSREGLEAYLAKEPEPTSRELGAMVESIRLFPYTLRRVFPDAAKEAAKKLPHQPGGRPKALDVDDYPRVCKTIGKLLAEGVKLRDAQQRVALREDVSLRTIQRAWQKRSEIASRNRVSEL